MPSGTLYVVGTPIGNLSDLSERASETLRKVEVVYAEDTRRTGRLLEVVGSGAELRSLHEHNEARRSEELVGRLDRGVDCALVTDAGTPAVSDPGQRAVAAAAGDGHRVVPVPGPSAVLAALSVSGLPADRFLFLGFPPRCGGERERWMARCRESPETVVAFESPHRVAALLEDWAEAGLGGRTCAVGRELTKLHEEVLRGTVRAVAEEVAGRELRGEVTVVLEGAPEVGWEEREAEAEEAAREMAREGRSTRDIARRLQERLDVPRNAAYEIGLRAAEEVE